MTYEEVEALYEQSAKASTWPSPNPRIMCFWKKDHKDLPESDKYIKVPFKDVAPHMEPTGYTEPCDVFYKLRKR